MEIPKECAGYILEKNACTFFPHKTGRTFPDGNPKAKISMKAMAWPSRPTCSSHVRFARGELSFGNAPRPHHLAPRWKIKHRAATTNENKIRTYLSRGNEGSQAIKQFNRLIHRRWVTGLLGTVTQARLCFIFSPPGLSTCPSSQPPVG